MPFSKSCLKKPIFWVNKILIFSEPLGQIQKISPFCPKSTLNHSYFSAIPAMEDTWFYPLSKILVKCWMNILTLINFQFNVLKDMALNKWMFHLFTNQVAGFYYFVNINIQITNVRQEAFVFCLRHLEKNGGDKIPLPLENTGKLNVTKKKEKWLFCI